MGGVLTLFNAGFNQEGDQLKMLDERKVKQDKIIDEIKEIENCIYCYVDKRLEKILLPWANKNYPWDMNSELLTTIREEPDQKSESPCFHSSKDSKYSQPNQVKITKYEYKLIFKLRCKVIDVKANMKKMHVQLKCGTCGLDQEHKSTF